MTIALENLIVKLTDNMFSKVGDRWVGRNIGI